MPVEKKSGGQKGQPPKAPPLQPPPIPKLSGKKAIGQIALLLVGPAIVMLVLALIWK
jgi:hypothetical protein